jgi:hypothetical protein
MPIATDTIEDMMEPVHPARKPVLPSQPQAGPVRQILATLLTKRASAGMISVLGTVVRPKRSKALEREIKSLIHELSDHLTAGRKPEALASALAILFADADYAIGKMRRDGVLRASKYGYEGLLVAGIAKAAIEARRWLVARDERFAYLESVIALARLAPAAKKLHDRIVDTLATRENVALKTVLAILNARFYNPKPADTSRSSLKLDRYSIEDVSDAASLILDIYRRLFTIHDHCCNHIDAEGVAGPAPIYERLFVAAIRLTKFRDAEVMIDGLPFQARWHRGAVRISAIDPDVEKSIRLGYIQGQSQVALRARDLEGARPAMSVREMIEQGFEHGALDGLLEFVDKPVRRFRLVLPTDPRVFQLFRSDQMFRDEVENLLMIDAEAFTTLDPDQPVTPQVTMRDLLKVQRYFNFISCLYQRKLETIPDEADRAYLTLTSTIPVIPHERLLEQIQLIFEDETKARAIIPLLAIDYEAAHLDLQYTPLIDLGSYYVVAPHVLAASNLVRNVTVAKKLRAFALDAGDPMVAAVVEAFRAAGFKVEADFKTNVNKVELDLVAWRDDALFLLECKNAYHPCSAHETRNSFDHIQVARDQLDVRRALFTIPSNQIKLFAGLGWDVPPTCQVHTGIIIANRVFHGAEFNGHPVRQAHELINILRFGTIGGDANLRIWTGDTFATDDLVTYLAGDSVATKQLQAFERYPIEIDLGERRLVFESHALDARKHMEIMVESYSPLPLDDAVEPPAWESGA